jgi:hypothetical protein
MKQLWSFTGGGMGLLLLLPRVLMLLQTLTAGCSRRCRGSSSCCSKL